MDDVFVGGVVIVESLVARLLLCDATCVVVDGLKKGHAGHAGIWMEWRR